MFGCILHGSSLNLSTFCRLCDILSQNSRFYIAPYYLCKDIISRNNKWNIFLHMTKINVDHVIKACHYKFLYAFIPNKEVEDRSVNYRDIKLTYLINGNENLSKPTFLCFFFR